MKRIFLLVVCLVLAAGCANVPQESQPVVVPGERQGPGITDDVPDPPQGIDPLTLVRAFVGAGVKPAQNNAAARAYLDDQGRATWKPSRTVTVIQNTFGTVYAQDQPPDPNTLIVNVRGTVLGMLDQSSAFIPSDSPLLLQVKVRKQATGQWRIVEAPTELHVTESDFAANYTGVPVSFYVPSSGAFAPDLRYVRAKPQSGLPGLVMDQLVAGPSTSIAGAVKNLLGDPVAIDTNVKSLDDGTLVVPLTGLTGASDETRNLIAAQIVLSLQNVTQSRIRILADGAPLVPNHPDWRASELPTYTAGISLAPGLLGLMTVGGRVRSLGDGQPVPGPAGAGEYNVASAAQSVDGKRLAVVERVGGNVRLRIGDYGRELAVVGIGGGVLSRPTWRPGSGELWTVVDHQSIARMVLTPNGQWAAQTVNSADITQQGGISELRFSRDGSRVAAVVDGRLIVASVVGTGDSVALREPRILQRHDLTDVIDVDWLSQETLVAATKSASQPVVKVLLDGLRLDRYNSSNLTTPVHGVTAAPSHAIVVADATGLWIANEVGEVWRPQSHTQPDADPFYPG